MKYLTSENDKPFRILRRLRAQSESIKHNKVYQWDNEFKGLKELVEGRKHKKCLQVTTVERSVTSLKAIGILRLMSSPLNQLSVIKVTTSLSLNT